MTKEKVDFDEYADNYDELLDQQLNFFSEDVDYYAKYKVNIVVDYLLKHKIDRPLRILEFGCGTGRNLISFRQKYPGAELTGYDLSKKSIDIANNEIEGATFTSDLSELKQDYYDLIFIAGVYHHIEPEIRPDVTQGVFNYLNTQGLLFVFEHNPYNPVTRKMVRECPFDEDAVLLKTSEMKRLLSKIGFNVVSLKYTLFFPPNLTKSSEKLDKLFTWLPLGGQYYVVASK